MFRAWTGEIPLPPIIEINGSLEDPLEPLDPDNSRGFELTDSGTFATEILHPIAADEARFDVFRR